MKSYFSPPIHGHCVRQGERMAGVWLFEPQCSISSLTAWKQHGRNFVKKVDIAVIFCVSLSEMIVTIYKTLYEVGTGI